MLVCVLLTSSVRRTPTSQILSRGALQETATQQRMSCNTTCAQRAVPTSWHCRWSCLPCSAHAQVVSDCADGSDFHLCRPWLEEEIQLLDPQVILLMGRIPMKAVLGEQRGITKVRTAADILPCYTRNCADFNLCFIQQCLAADMMATTVTKCLVLQVRGEWYTRDGRSIMPMFHPSYLLRNPDRRPGVVFGSSLHLCNISSII